MLISQAFAQETPPVEGAQTTTATTAADGAPLPPPDTKAILIQNVGMIVLLMVLFYFLLIRPQQKRFKEHKEMVDALKPGDRVIVGGGLIGSIDKLIDKDEVVVDLGSGVKVTSLRSSIQARVDLSAKSDSVKK